VTIECKINTNIKYHGSKFFLPLSLDVININRDGFAFCIIPLVSKNGLKMGNLFHSLLATPTILIIKIVDPLAPQSHG
jgi:hypothetical protein